MVDKKNKSKWMAMKILANNPRVRDTTVIAVSIPAEMTSEKNGACARPRIPLANPYACSVT